MIQSLESQDSWMDILSESSYYDEITARADSWFEKRGTGRGSGYKHYQRWKEEAKHRIDDNGEIRYAFKTQHSAYQKLNKRSSQYRSTNGSWEVVGPSTYSVDHLFIGGGLGRVSCTAFHPTDANTMWLGTPAGGLWKTTDAGNSWAPLTDGFPTIGIAGIAISPSNPNHITILTGDNATSNTPSMGALYSLDGGESWEESDMIFPLSSQVRPSQLKQHPTLGNVLFAAFRSGQGLYRSLDMGRTWSQVISGRAVWDVEVKPGQNDLMYAAVSQDSTATLMVSFTQGFSWGIDDDIDFPIKCARMAIAISPSAPNNMYALFGGGTGVNGTFRGLYKSTDSGNDFTLMSSTPNILGWAEDGGDAEDQAGRDLAIIVNPTNDSQVFTGAVCIWRTDDSGITWDRQTWFRRNDPEPYVHADFQNFYFRGDTLWVNNDGGIYYSTNNAHSFVELSAGLTITQYYYIDVYNNTFMGGSQDNGTTTGAIGGTDGHFLSGGDGRGCTWHSGNDQIQFTSSQDAVYRNQFGGLLPILSTTGGWIGQVSMHVTDPNYLFVEQGRMLRRGKEDFLGDWSWVPFSTGVTPNATDISCFSQSFSDPEVMFISMEKTILKTSDLSSTLPMWSLVNLPSFTPPWFSNIVVNPNDTSEVWVTGGGMSPGRKVWYSSDSGNNWTNISGTLPNVSVRCIEYAPGTNDGLYIGTDIGVFYRDATKSDWIYFGNYLPNVPVNDIDIPGDGYVYAGTYGRGIWRSQTYTNCPTTLLLTETNDLTSNQVGTQEFYASNNILSVRQYDGNPGSNILYTAGSHIDLSLGFEAKHGAYFEVKTGDCPN